MVENNRGIGASSVDADAVAPFGGTKWRGQEREGGIAAIEEYTELKWIAMEKEDMAYPF